MLNIDPEGEVGKKKAGRYWVKMSDALINPYSEFYLEAIRVCTEKDFNQFFDPIDPKIMLSPKRGIAFHNLFIFGISRVFEINIVLIIIVLLI